MAEVSFDLEKMMNTLAQQEVEGYTFYEKVAAAATNEKTKKAFMKYANDERRHETFYKKQAKKYAGKTIMISSDDADFIDMLLSSPNPIKTAEQGSDGKTMYSREQAEKIAEKLESDTIMLLGQIMSASPELAEEKAFKDALREERFHLSSIRQSQADFLAGHMML
jgi:rubrerythrin